MKTRNTIGKILGVGGLVVALNFAGACETDKYMDDVKVLAELHGWKSVTAERREKKSTICQNLSLYRIEGVAPNNNYSSAFICCGVIVGGCKGREVDCRFLETNTEGGN